MRPLGLCGVRRANAKRTIGAADLAARPRELVHRQFSAPEPNRLGLAEITYALAVSGCSHVSFITDDFARRLVDWLVSNSFRTDPAFDASEMAI